jgi:1,2-diacylglycerol 3-beta-galactosyltransferase
MPPRRVLLPFLNTGGGHQSAALAVAEALQEVYGKGVQAEIVDVTTEHFPWPLSKLNATYDRLVHLNGWPWALIYHLTDGPSRVAMLEGTWWLLTGRSILSLLSEHPADVIVCCHPLLKAPTAHALDAKGCKTPLITLVTDLASGHAAWFHPSGVACLVATEQARKQALACGLAADSVQVTGLPVRSCFVRAVEWNVSITRKKLGLDAGRPVVLLLSGADGMGPFHALLRAIMTSVTDAQVVAITGRNEKLRTKLSSERWSRPLHVKGFVENIHEWMRAANLLVTKAGPATIAEALVVGTPMILSGAVPGQEPPNVRYATETGAAVWAPSPAQAAQAVQELLSSHSERLQQMTHCAREAGCPTAARRVAQIVWRRAGRSTGRQVGPRIGLIDRL